MCSAWHGTGPNEMPQAAVLQKKVLQGSMHVARHSGAPYLFSLLSHMKPGVSAKTRSPFLNCRRAGACNLRVGHGAAHRARHVPLATAHPVILALLHQTSHIAAQDLGAANKAPLNSSALQLGWHAAYHHWSWSPGAPWGASAPTPPCPLRPAIQKGGVSGATAGLAVPVPAKQRAGHAPLDSPMC